MVAVVEGIRFLEYIRTNIALSFSLIWDFHNLIFDFLECDKVSGDFDRPDLINNLIAQGFVPVIQSSNKLFFLVNDL